jgi:hypothetical protein
VYGISVTSYLGTDKEKYRWHFLIKNNRDMDDYDPVIDMTHALGLGSSAFAATISDTIDVEQWLEAFAAGCTSGAGDNWVANAGHNAMFYFRPTDGKMLFFLHDLDYAYDQGRSVESNSVLRKLLATPTWAHDYYGYVYEFLQGSFNEAYMSVWAHHYHQLLPEQAWSSWLNYIDGRYRNVLNQVLAKAGSPVAFEITSPSDAVVTSLSAPIRGRGWIDVHDVTVVETGQTLTLNWSNMTTWEAYLPADLALGAYTLAAQDCRGRLLATVAITLTPRP